MTTLGETVALLKFFITFNEHQLFKSTVFKCSTGAEDAGTPTIHNTCSLWKHLCLKEIIHVLMIYMMCLKGLEKGLKRAYQGLSQ